MGEPPGRLRPPFSIRESDAAFWLVDAEGRRFAFSYFRDPRNTSTGFDLPEKATAEQITRWLANSPATVPRLDASEREALGRFIASQPNSMTEAEAMRLLIREALIGMGDLPLGPENRSRGARRS